MGRQKKKSDLESGIEKIVRRELDDMTGDDENEILSETIDESRIISPQEDPILNNILRSFPSSEGYYGKLYRKNHSGKLEFKYFIDHLEDVDDPELEIASLAKERNWKGGEFILRVMKRNEPGTVKVISWNMSMDETNPPGQTTEASHAQSPIENLQSMKDLITTVKDITGADSKDSHKVIAETFKSGVEAMKSMIPPISPAPINQPVNYMEMMGSILGLIEKMGVFKQKEEPKQDMFELIVKLKETGLIQMAGEKEDNTLDSVSKIGQLIEVLAPYTKGASMEQPSVWLKLIEVLGPQVPKIVENITESVNKIAEVSKIKLSSRLGVATPLPAISSPSFEIPNKPPIEEVRGDLNNMNPLIKEIYDAIQMDDKQFHPRLKQLMTLYIGPHIFETLISKTVSIDEFLKSLSSMMKESFFLEENSKRYFKEFLGWIESSVVPAKCDVCGEIFDFESEEAFNKDPQTCEVCGGKLSKIILETLTGSA